MESFFLYYLFFFEKDDEEINVNEFLLFSKKDEVKKKI